MMQITWIWHIELAASEARAWRMFHQKTQKTELPFL